MSLLIRVSLFFYLFAGFASWAMEEEEFTSDTDWSENELEESSDDDGLDESRGADANQMNIQFGPIFQYRFNSESSINSVRFSEDGASILFATDEHPYAAFKSENGHFIGYSARFEHPLKCLTVNRTSTIWVSVSCDGQMFAGDNLSDTIIEVEGDYKKIQELVLSPTGNHAVAICNDITSLCDTRLGNRFPFMETNTDPSRCMLFASFSPDGLLMATNSPVMDKNAVCIVSLDSSNFGNLNKISLSDELQPKDDDYVGTLYLGVPFGAFSPDGKLLATACYDYKIYLVNVENRKIIRRLVGHESLVTSAKFLSDGARLMMAAQDETIKMWDVASGDLLFTIQRPNHKPTKCVQVDAEISPDGTQIGAIFGIGVAGIYDAMTGQHQYTICEGHDQSICFKSLQSITECNARSLCFSEGTWSRQNSNLAGAKSTEFYDNPLLLQHARRVDVILLPTDDLRKPRTLKMMAYISLIKNYLGSSEPGSATYEGFILHLTNSNPISGASPEEIENTVFDGLDIYTQRYLDAIIPGRPIETGAGQLR